MICKENWWLTTLGFIDKHYVVIWISEIGCNFCHAELDKNQINWAKNLESYVDYAVLADVNVYILSICFEIKDSQVQSSAAITRSSLTQYYIRHSVAKDESHIRITIDTPYLALTGEQRGVYCEEMGENWPRYDSISLKY